MQRKRHNQPEEDMIDAILERRSIRKYDRSRAVDRETLTTLLRAAMYAPSARNLRPWQFIVITDRLLLDKITGVHPYAAMLKEATAAILVCGDRNKDPNDFYLVQNGAAATQNIMLEAYNQGLGSVWLGVYGREDRMQGLSGLFHLPEHLLPVALIGLGYAAEEKPIPERFEPELIHDNSFGETWKT